VKFAPAKQGGSPFESDVKLTANVSGLSKPRSRPHWYYNNENWSVAEFMTQILRLQPEVFLPVWLRRLGIILDESALDTVLCWPRFSYGKKTIQPDVAIGFEKDIVLLEFKRADGGSTPGKEVLGQLCFALEAGRRLRRNWCVLLIPGRESATRSITDYAMSALGAGNDAQAKWGISDDTVREVKTILEGNAARKLHVISWEHVLRETCGVIRDSVSESWSKQQALSKLQYFYKARVDAGLLA
jgi:hypothetical protein